MTSSAQPRLVELADLGMAEMEGFRATNKIRDAALHLDGKKLIVRLLPSPGDDFGEPNGEPTLADVRPRQAATSHSFRS